MRGVVGAGSDVRGGDALDFRSDGEGDDSVAGGCGGAFHRLSFHCSRHAKMRLKASSLVGIKATLR